MFSDEISAYFQGISLTQEVGFAYYTHFYLITLFQVYEIKFMRVYMRLQFIV